MSGSTEENRARMLSRLSLSNYDWSHLPFFEWLDLAKKFGITQIEGWSNTLSFTSIATVQQELARRDIRVICVNATVAFLPNRTDDIGRVQAGIIAAIEQAEALGARYVNTYLGPNPARDLITTVRHYKQAIQPCLQAAAERGITLVMENHFDIRNEDPKGTDVARRPETLRYLIEEVASPYFKATFDPCNFYIAGVEPYPYAYEVLQPYIGYIHLKDAVRYYELLHGGTESIKLLPDSIAGPFLPVAVGSGAVNYEGLLNRLAEDGYDGYLTVEPHTERARLEPVSAESLRYLRSHLRTPNV